MSDQKKATPDAVIIGVGTIEHCRCRPLLARGLKPLVLKKGPSAEYAIRE